MRAQHGLVFGVGHAVVEHDLRARRGQGLQLGAALRGDPAQQVQGHVRQFGHAADHGLHVLVGHERAHVEQRLVRARLGVRGVLAVLRGVADDPDRTPGEPVLRHQGLGGGADGRDDVGPVQQEPLGPERLVVQAPQDPDRGGQEAGRRGVLVVDQVVQGQHQGVLAAPAAHGLHGAHHHVGAEPVDLARHEELGGGERAVDQGVGHVRQQGQLPGIADEHGDVRDLGRGGDEAGAVAADAVVVVQPGEAGIDEDFHAGWSFRKRRMKPAAGSGVS